MTKRLEAMGQEKYAGLVNPGKGHFNGVVKCHEDELTKPLRWRTPRRVFVNSMSDLFHEKVPFDFIDEIFAVMALCAQHQFQLLTKRPKRMAQYLVQATSTDNLQEEMDRLTLKVEGEPFAYNQIADGGQWPLPNVWLGTSVENQEAADERIPHLLRCPAAVRFLSCEPLLGPVDLSGWMETLDRKAAGDEGLADGPTLVERLHQVIVGGESGPGARPMHPDWARSLRDACAASGVAFFFKQHGEWIAIEDVGRVAFQRVGKKRAGRLLDGREWNEYPDEARRGE
jgi:protein gp37